MRTILSLLILALPLKHLQVTSAFGNRLHPITLTYRRHDGVDLRANYDTVYAVMNSRVEAVGYNPALGIFIIINNGPFCVTYGHLSECFVSKGDSVTVTGSLGISGETGRVTGPHLHFAVQYGQHYINPLKFLLLAECEPLN
jgi:murein DD-endopeptidase MepM/ murein hydrolase activator NlpD